MGKAPAARREPAPRTPAPDAGPWLARSLRGRGPLLGSLGLLVGLGLASATVWRIAEPSIRDEAQYRVTPSSVTLSPPPPWVRSDVRAEAMQNAGLLGADPNSTLSILDGPDRLEKRLSTALGFHPWVRSVGAIRKAPPNLVSVEVEYRRPLAAVTTGGPLLPIDVDGVLLPARDLTPEELSWLPRIDARPSAADVTSPQPRVGERWADPRLIGAVALVASIGAEWNRLCLLEVIPASTPEVRGDQRYCTFELRTTGNTRIGWGAAPGFAPPDESPFAEKLARLRAYIAANGPLDTTASPEWIDVRNGLTTRPRMVRRDTGDGAAEVVK
ncbi:MAG: cell division protein FtsQ/DivIB [Lacipirellulaceae bacterium]